MSDDPLPERKKSVLDEIQQFICNISGLPPLEDFSWHNLFSASFKFKGREELDNLFNCGSDKTTPDIGEVQAQWPRPHAFSQVLLLSLTTLLCFYIGVEVFGNINALPGLMIVGAFAIPLTSVIFFFELNILRNISTYQIAKLVLFGGVLSIILSLFFIR